MGFTVTHCIDHGSDEGKNASLKAFHEGLKSFPYQDYFNSSFFNDHHSFKNLDVLEITAEESKKSTIVYPLITKFKEQREENIKAYERRHERDTIVFGVNFTTMSTKI